MEPGELGREYAPGEAICRQGELGDCMYVVQSGEVVVSRRVEGVESVVALLGPGESFGEIAILGRQPRSDTVRALGRARILALDRRASARRLQEDPSLAFRVFQQVAERMRRVDEPPYDPSGIQPQFAKSA